MVVLSPQKKKKQNKKKQNKQGENGRFTRCYFRAEILQIDKFWTQLILEDPYISTWRSSATEFPSEICAILHDRHTDIGACI